MAVTLISMDMYKPTVVGQLQRMPGDRDKQIHWLTLEESSLMREATRLSQENPDEATDILLKYMERLTYVRQVRDNISKAPLFA